MPLLGASLSRDPRLVAGVATTATLPLLLLPLLMGVITDRYDRRMLMRRASLARASLAAAIAILVALHAMTLPVLYGLVFVLGAGKMLFDTASQAILPDLVATDQLTVANSRWQVGSMAGTVFVGPPLGAVLFTVLMAAPFWADTATILIALGLTGMIAGHYPPRPTAVGTSPTVRRSVREEMAQGVVWLFRHRLLRALAIVLCLANLAIYLTEGIMVLFALKDLSMRQSEYGFLLTGIAIGGLLGGAAGAVIAQAVGTARAIVLTIGVIAVCYLVIGMLSDALVVIAIGSCTGFGTGVWNVVTISLRQALIPRELMGRVNSAYLLLGMGSLPVGTVLGGVLAAMYGLRSPFFVASALLLVALGLAAFQITERRVSAAFEAAPNVQADFLAEG